tara:strand:+ start:153 stop:302 length:150 start_codon:yes stop_codon:yes gene_type:complete
MFNPHRNPNQVRAQDYAAPLATFLGLPIKNVARSFTLSMKAKPKKKNQP